MNSNKTQSRLLNSFHEQLHVYVVYKVCIEINVIQYIGIFLLHGTYCWNFIFLLKFCGGTIRIRTFSFNPYGEFFDPDLDPYEEFPDPGSGSV